MCMEMKYQNMFLPNKNVAYVAKNGKVTGKSKGKAAINVKMKSGCQATCKVIVK